MRQRIVSSTSGQALCTTLRRCFRIGLAKSGDLSMYESMRASMVGMEGASLEAGQWSAAERRPRGGGSYRASLPNIHFVHGLTSPPHPHEQDHDAAMLARNRASANRANSRGGARKSWFDLID